MLAGFVIFLLLSVLSLLVVLVSVFTSVVVFVSLKFYKELRNAPNILVANLAINGLLFSLNTTFNQIVLWCGRDDFTEMICLALPAYSMCCGIVTSLLILILALNRYLAVAYPVHFYTRWYSNRRSVAYCIFVWLLSALSTVSPLLKNKGEYVDELRICAMHSEQSTNAFISFLSIFFLYFPIILLYALTWRSARKKPAQLQEQQQVNFVQMEAPGIAPFQLNIVQNLPQMSQFANTVKLTKYIFCLSILILLLCLPLSLKSFVVSEKQLEPWLIHLFVFLAYLAIVLHSSVYVWLHKRFRTRIQKLFYDRDRVRPL